jgi:hypothetical protein
VALSGDGNTALIGEAGDNNQVGAAWVFRRRDSTWTQLGGKLTGGGEIGTGRFGISVALSFDGKTALIGGERQRKRASRSIQLLRCCVGLHALPPDMDPAKRKLTGGVAFRLPARSVPGRAEAILESRRAISRRQGCDLKGMEPTGIEPVTSCLQSRRSPS